MNGAHDCGGVAGYGPVVPEAGEPVFHQPWEARMFALMSAVGDIGGWTLDDDRSACESMPPARYIATSYYEHWLNELEILLERHGLATAAEIRDGKGGFTGAAGFANARGPHMVAGDCARRLQPAGTGPGAIQHRRHGPYEHAVQPHAHASAGISARPHGDRCCPSWGARLSRQQRHREGRRPAVALHGAVCVSRPVRRQHQ